MWDDELGYTNFRYRKYAYVKDENGNYKSIFGDKLSKLTRIDYNYDYGDSIFESDVSPETRTLVDLYYDKEIDKFPDHSTVIFDIECETDYTLPDVDKAENKITSIAFLDVKKEQYYVLLLDEKGTLNSEDINLDIKLHFESYKREDILLERFIELINKINPTIMSGWNINFFDVPYIINRCIRIIGKEKTRKISPIGLINKNPFTNKFVIAGINLLDYLELYKKFTYSEEPSYRLDLIAKKETGKGKIEFEGSLQELYDGDKHKFIEYNINDVQLVYNIDKRVKFIDLVIGISHKGKIKYEDIMYSSRYLEGAILSYLKIQNLISPNKPHIGGVPFTGAFVKTPQNGYYKWIYDLDLTSLYPSTIISLNISPETKIAKIIDWDVHKYLDKSKTVWEVYHYKYDKTIEMDSEKLKKFLEDSKYNISINGIMYINSNERKGVLPALLENWFNERVKYKNLMKKYGKENNNELYEYYDKLQNIQKVMLNSLYGVLGLPIFRYYDRENAAAVTTTGQEIIKYSENKLNEFYHNILNSNNIEIELENNDIIKIKSNDKIKIKRNNKIIEIYGFEILETDELI